MDSTVLLIICVLGHGAQSQVLHLEQGKNVLVSIWPSVFESILDSEKPFWNVDMSRDVYAGPFLNTFNRFLLTFDFANRSDASFKQLQRICTAAAKYNKETYNDTVAVNKLEIWISIIPQGSMTEQLELVDSVIKETNLICNGTVPVFVLHYRSLRLGLETLPLVNEDIRLSRQVLRHNAPMLFGIILDVRNCYGSDRYFRSLDLSYINIALFMTSNENYKSVHLEGSSLSSCLLRMYKIQVLERHDYMPAYGYKLPMPSVLSFKHKVFVYNPSELEFVLNRTVVPNILPLVPVIEVMPRGHKSNYTQTDPVLRTIYTEEKWLRQDFTFSREFTGIVTYSHFQQTNMETLMPSIWNTFCKVMVQQLELSPDSPQNMSRFTNKLLDKYRNTESLNGQCDESLIEMVLAAHAYQNHSSSQFEDMNNAIVMSLVGIANDISRKKEGISMTLLLNWNICFGLQDCEEVDDRTIVPRKDYGDPFVFVPFVNQTKNLIAKMQISKRPKVGILMDWQICHQLHTLHFFDLRVKKDRTEFKILDVLMFRMYVHKQRIVENGALKTSAEVAGGLQKCTSFLNKATLTDDPTEFVTRPAYNVIIYGCDGKWSDLKELEEVARFWELMSSWAVSLETEIYLGSAVEPMTKRDSHEKENCTLNEAQASLERCDCGWWRASLSKQDSITANTSFSFEDRKSIALNLFEETYYPPPRQPDIPNDTPVTLILVPTFLLVAIIVVATTLAVRNRIKNRFIIAEAEILFRGNAGLRHSDDNNAQTCGAALHIPYNRERFELQRKSFKIDFSKPLGSGEFGRAYQGTLKSGNEEMIVAVKTVKKVGGDIGHGFYLALKGLVSEIKILSYLEEHDHIVKFIGAYTGKLKSGKLFVFLEHCELGSLLTYLRSCRSEGGISNGMDFPQVLLHDLYRWSREIACGMEFLATKNMVHADLAARNVLLNASRCAKISDFGLSRRLYNYSEYLKQEAGPLPWRWMAPESLRRLTFNEKSDVWAFGVTLWEIFSLGDEPYPGLSWDVNFPQMLRSGLRLDKPRYSEDRVYALMAQCWGVDPNNRPSFSELKTILPDPSYEFVMA